MPSYVQPPTGKAIALLPGVAGYSFGSFNDRAPYSRFTITNVALTTNVVTLTVQLIEGLIPIVGALITTQGLQTSSALNVQNVALASVSINLTTGAGTLTFPLTHANISSTADSGLAIVPQPIVPDTLANGSGQQFAVQAASGVAEPGTNISWFYNFPSPPTTVTINLQGADVDQDGFYTTIDTVAVTSSTGYQTTRAVNTPQKWNFLRINVASVVGGTSPTIAAGIVI
jgi:hypothetical protein